jgi:hypothetical protein
MQVSVFRSVLIRYAPTERSDGPHYNIEVDRMKDLVEV